MSLKVMMVPHARTSHYHGESGIKTLVAKYFDHLPKYDIELVDHDESSFDLLAVHAGMTNNFGDNVPMVSHIHGLYWTADYPAYIWQHKANRSVTESIKHADLVTVPSEWVAQTLRRDMHYDPWVLRHGIDWEEWQHNFDNQEYVLWNKNRAMDVCSPRPVSELAIRRPNVKFLTTFAEGTPTPNIKTTGVVRHDVMRKFIQKAGVYLATTKETFGIGTLEAMASGVPVLGFNYGGTADIVEHGKTGYLARIGDFDDLANGLDYCIANRSVLGQNGSIVARRKFGWGDVAKELSEIYQAAVGLESLDRNGNVGVVIPCYNKVGTLERAVNSVLAQTTPAQEIIIVDNNSQDGSRELAEKLSYEHSRVYFMPCEKQGVAHARNAGVSVLMSEYACCLDADDEIQPGFLEACMGALKSDRTLGLAYTRLRAIDHNGLSQVSEWPGEYHYDEFLQRRNQVPTCCVFRTELFRRTGGYRQRYAPHGAGSEDAELWLKMGSLGYGGRLATDEALFDYHLGGQVSGDPGYSEVDWLAWHPWVEDGGHPFASCASPANGLSHEVRQYDQPVVSVIIPTSSKHLDDITEAIDSLEAQSFRKWELIVVLDGSEKGTPYIPSMLREAYPYINWIILDKNYGPGYARNRGAEAAKAPLLLFLDADDWLVPECLELMLRSYESAPDTIIYTDYYAHSHIESDTEIRRLQVVGRMKHYDSKTKEAIVYHKSLPYDCERAQYQPDPGNMYIWNLITSLVPKKFHKDIGGFDEQMDSAWEDWDYWLRMSHKGHCFTYLSQPLVEYRFWTGTRRAAANPEESGEEGLQLGVSLIKYLQEKYEGVEKMACGGCAKHRATPVARPVVPLASSLNEGSVKEATSEQLVWVELDDGNIGSHPISFEGTNYGYRSSGEKFKMYRDHADRDIRVRIIEPDMMKPKVEEEIEEIGEPEPEFAEWGDLEKEEDKSAFLDTGEEFDPVGSYVEVVDEVEGQGLENETIVLTEYAEDLLSVWGVTEERALSLNSKLAVNTVDELTKVSVDQLIGALGVTPTVARRMISSARSMA